ncbi:MAG: hypothetical protein ACI89X_001002 [Planctomycetota bacterium]|jgi:hypothetical protein
MRAQTLVILTGRYFFLLASLAVLGLMYPVLLEGRGGRAVWTVALWMVLCGGWRAIQPHPRVRAAGVGFVIAALCGGAWHLVADEAATAPLIMFAATNFVFLGITAAVLLGDVLGGGGDEVDVDKILGVVCAYIVIGLAFAFLFLLVHALQPSLGAVTPKPHEPFLADYLYFSFATLTTVGYGDLAPEGAFSRLFAAVEAVTGMLYVTIVVARLVGLHVAQRPSRRE